MNQAELIEDVAGDAGGELDLFVMALSRRDVERLQCQLSQEGIETHLCFEFIREKGLLDEYLEFRTAATEGLL